MRESCGKRFADNYPGWIIIVTIALVRKFQPNITGGYNQTIGQMLTNNLDKARRPLPTFTRCVSANNLQNKTTSFSDTCHVMWRIHETTKYFAVSQSNYPVIITKLLDIICRVQ